MRLSPAGPRPRVSFVGLNDADEQVDEYVLLGGRERRKYLSLCFDHLGSKSSANCLSMRGQPQFASTAIGATDNAFDQALCFEPINQLANIGAIEPHQRRQSTLVDAGEIVENGNSRIFLGRFGLLILQRFCGRPGENLVEASHQGIRDVVRHDTVPNRSEL